MFCRWIGLSKQPSLGMNVIQEVQKGAPGVAVLSMVINLTLPRVGGDLAKAKGGASAALEVSLHLVITIFWSDLGRGTESSDRGYDIYCCFV